MKRTALLLAAGLAATALTGCSMDDDYVAAPTSYGAAGHCYYIDNPGEVAALQAAGLCPVGWTPMSAPTWYRDSYAPYFASPVYVEHYVPVAVRKTYVTHVTTYNTQHSTQIKQATSKVSTSQRVQVKSGTSTYRSGDRPESSTSKSSGSSSRVSVGSSSGRSFSSGSRK